MDDKQLMMGKHVIERLESKLELALKQEPLDVDYLEFVCRSEMSLIASLSTQIDFPQEVFKGLQELSALVDDAVDKMAPKGRPKVNVLQAHVEELMELDLSTPCIARLLGISQRTLFRRMREWGLSVMDTYSSISDDDLDRLISEIKDDLPHLGYRMVRGRLRELGYRVQWVRIQESIHRIDALGVIQRLNKLGCAMKGINIVPSPLSLVHIDSNYKLVRYGIVLFGGIDGYSKKLLYLKVANNNKAKTALDFFLRSVDQYVCPSRVRGDWHVENAAIAKHMFATRGRGGFMSSRSLHSEQIELVWHSVWNAVCSMYCGILRSLEEEGILNPNDRTHIFCVQHVFLCRIQKDLDTFLDGWNEHSLHTENNLTPNQLWETGMSQASASQQDNAEGCDIPEVERAFETGVQVPEQPCPLNMEQLLVVEELFDINAPSTCFGKDIFSDVLHYVQTLLEDA